MSSLTVAAGDTPLVIRGRLTGQAAAFSGNLRLTAQGGNATDLQVLAPDLYLTQQPDVVIDRSNITIPSGTALTAGQPRDVRVTVNNVTRPGEYRPVSDAPGLRLLLPGQTEAQALVVPITLQVDAPPNVRLLGANPSFQLVHCRIPILDCLLGPWFLGGSVVHQDATLLLDNQTQVAVARGSDPVIVMRGEKTGTMVSSDAMSLTVPDSFPAREVVQVPVKLDPQKVWPDHYTGTILISPKGADDRLTINADVSVREGPVLALLAVLLGIVVGRVSRDMQTPAAQVQVKLLPRWYHLNEAANSVLDPKAHDFVLQELQSLRQRIEAGTGTEEVLTQEMDKQAACIDFLASLENLDRQLKGLGLDAPRQKLLPLIQQARDKVLAGDQDGARQLRDQVQEQLAQVAADTPMGNGVAAVAVMVSNFRNVGARFSSTQAAQPAATQLTRGRVSRWLAPALALVSGVSVMSASTRYWLFRPLLYVVLLLLLVLLGMQALYVNAGATFGAAGLYDYLGLFLWGLSADIAQRTLQNLPVPK